MKVKKLVQTLTVVGAVLSLGAATAASTFEGEAATVISNTGKEKVMAFSKADLKKATNVDLTLANVNTVYTHLKKADTWTSLGYSSSEATVVANRFALSKNQALGILREIAGNNQLSLKVVVVAAGTYTQANIGTISVNAGNTGNDGTAEGGQTGNGEDSSGTTTPETPAAGIAGVKKIEVDIEYKKQDIEFEYEVKSNGTIKAEYENEFTGEDLEGAAAQVKIESIFTGLDIRNSSQTQIKNYLLTKLNAGQDFKQFEFTAKFNDNTKFDFKIK